MVCSKIYKFTSSENKYISELDMSENIGNWMSRSDKILESAELSKLKDFIDSQIYVYKKTLILFPSLLEHDVETNKSSKERTSISFNTFVRGVIGNTAQLSEVTLS
jgi:hypothetical protein